MKLSTVFPDLIQSGQARVRLQPVEINPSKGTLPPWRTPDTIRSSDRGAWNARESGLTARHMDIFAAGSVDFPIEIGGFLSLSLDPETDDGRSLYRLGLESDLNVRGFVFARRLAPLLFGQRPTDDELALSRFTVGSAGSQQTIDSPFHFTIAPLLPAESLFTSSLLRLAQAAANRTAVLVHGEKGCGKTHAALLIAAIAQLKQGSNVVYLNCGRLRDSRMIRMNALLAELCKVFDEAAAPSVVVLDDLDTLAPALNDIGSPDDSLQVHQINPVEIDQSKLISDVVRHLLRVRTNRTSVIVTSRAPDSLPASLLSEGKFIHRFEVPGFDDIDRALLYGSFLRRLSSPVNVSVGAIPDFARKTHGFRPRDLEQLALRTKKNMISQARSNCTLEQATTVELETIVPFARLGTLTEPTGAGTSWFNVGGLFAAKAVLTSTIMRPSMYRRIYERAKIRLPRGILLYGFPGTGKSMCVPALAQECGFPLITCRGPEVLDKYIGASEAKIRDLFTRAAAAAPSILFFDELDALAPRRGSDHTGVTDRIVNQLLTFLDGVEDSARTGPVYVIAATSRPDKIDPALLRPGRLEKHIFFGLAEENADELTDLIVSIARSFRLDADTMALLESGEFVRNVRQAPSSLARRLSAADLKAAFNAGQLAAVHEALALGLTNELVTISYAHLFEAFVSTRPSLSDADYDRLNEIFAVYRHDVRPRSDNFGGSKSALQSKQLRTALK